MAKKISRNIFLTALLVVALCGALLLGVMADLQGEQTRTELRDSAWYVSRALSISGDDPAFLRSIAGRGTRITLIAPDGTVLYDSDADAAGMENHLDRPEVQEALRGVSGESTRLSDTLLTRTHYYALRLEDGNVLRLAATRRSVWSVAVSMLGALTVIVLGLLLLSLLLGHRLAARVIRPINELDLDEPLANNSYEELAPLLTRIENQKKELSRRADELKERQEEFSTVTAGMSEGLILLGARRNVILANPSACALFDADATTVAGRDLLALTRTLSLSDAADEALAGTASTRDIEIAGRSYELLVNPVRRDGAVTGCVMLILDVTEKRRAEQLRREFSANVSHELKTPLQSISGYAEIIGKGLVRDEDLPRFIEKIHAESLRLIDLIDDILKLSRLDEGGAGLETEPVDLLALCGEVAERLGAAAQERGVSLTVTGEAAVIPGVRSALTELVYNLADNAVKYNRPGGSVELALARQDGGVTLTVTDTGVGMAAEHLPRVFERFYRADSGRAPGTGGTGLGLSIVKRSAALHGAEVSIKSREKRGTAVTVRFPQR